MITATEEAREALRDVEHPEGTVLRLNPISGHRPDEVQVRLAVDKKKGPGDLAGTPWTRSHDYIALRLLSS